MIKTSLKYSCLFILASLISFTVYPQSSDSNMDQVKSLVDFYRYMLNTVGAEKSSTRDKEVIITESYRKVFKDSEVQIEDDLLPDRNAINNKNVSAYLRDVDFFFQDINFEFTDVEVTKSTRENGEDFYLVSFNSMIKATTLEGEPYSNSQKRYIEVNFIEEASDLKIVSVYSTKVSREKELQLWWESLSYEWRNIFDAYTTTPGSPDSNELMKIAGIDSLDLEGNQYIQNIDPLSALNNLTYLDISNTRIENLEPIRFALKLNYLDASGSRVSDISLLQYFENLEHLNLSKTPIYEISYIGRLKQLKTVDLSSTSVTVFDALQHLTNLVDVRLSNTAYTFPAMLSGNKNLYHLDLSSTGVANIDYLAEFGQLKYLDLSDTYINNLKALKDLNNLETLKINQTQVFSLDPLEGLKSLRRIYCDNSGITEKKGILYMNANPNVLVINNTEKVLEWWNTLDRVWKGALKPFIRSENPAKEDLIRLINIDSINISNKNLVETEPLSKFKKLRHLVIDGNLFTNVGFAADMEYLEVLMAENLPLDNVSTLSGNKNLQALSIKGTLVTDITPLVDLNKLQILDIDNTPVLESQVVDFLQVHPGVTILYKSSDLQAWWNQLEAEWVKVFNLDNPNSLELHRLIEQEEIIIENTPISNLRPLDQFITLKKVSISNTGITNLQDLSDHEFIEEITCKNGPLNTLESVGEIRTLKSLDISNTAVDDLRPLRPLTALEKLNASGTNLKRIKGLEDLLNLKYLDISNTRIWQLDRLHNVRDLQTLICYNTRARSREIEEIKAVFPDCQVNYY